MGQEKVVGIKSLDGVELGDLYQKPDGTVWRVVWLSPNPTIGLKRIDGGGEGETSGQAGCLNLADLVRLIPETKR